MGWDYAAQKRTLLIEKISVRHGQHKYAIFPFIRVEDGLGNSYLEPLPAMTSSFKLPGYSGYYFTGIEFIDTPSSGVMANACDVNLTHMGQYHPSVPRAFGS